MFATKDMWVALT